MTVNDFMIGVLRDAWTHFTAKVPGGKDAGAAAENGEDGETMYGEESIVLYSVARILNHIVVVSTINLIDL